MAAGVPNSNQLIPFSQEALQSKSKMGSSMALPGLFYSQISPTAANVTSGTVTDNGASMIGALQLGTLTSGTLPLGGTCAVASFTSSSGALVTTTTSNFMPTTLTYDQMPVKFVLGASGVLPTNIVAGQTYYWQWVSGTTGRLSATPGGTVLPYVSDLSGTVYIQAATAYWGSPQIPAGFLQSALSLNQATPSSPPVPGCNIAVEIMGNALGTTTNISTFSIGLIGPTGTWTQIAATAAARANTGPYGFVVTANLIVQQYGQASVVAPYNQLGLIRGCINAHQPAASGSSAFAQGVWGKSQALDLTVPYFVDVRVIQATPVIGEYYEPCIVRMWAYN